MGGHIPHPLLHPLNTSTTHHIQNVHKSPLRHVAPGATWPSINTNTETNCKQTTPCASVAPHLLMLSMLRHIHLQNNIACTSLTQLSCGDSQRSPPGTRMEGVHMFVFFVPSCGSHITTHRALLCCPPSHVSPRCCGHGS